MDDDFSDDEDEHHVPHDWPTYDFLNLSVHEREGVGWEYKENEVLLGALCRSGDDVKDAIKRRSTLSLQTQFRVLKSSPHVYEVCCVHNNCPFRVHAYKGSGRIIGKSVDWWITLAYFSNWTNITATLQLLLLLTTCILRSLTTRASS